MEKQKHGDVKKFKLRKQALKTFFVTVAILFVPTAVVWIGSAFSLGSANGWSTCCDSIHATRYWDLGQFLLGFMPYIGLGTAALVSIGLAYRLKFLDTLSQVIVTIAITITVMVLINTVGMDLIKLSLI
jgi:hypothetical protein